MMTNTFISSDLQTIEKGLDENPSGSQLVIDNKVYVALAPDVYAWLRQQMEKAHSAFKSSKLAEESWNHIRKKFYPIHDQAIETWGKKDIEKALNETINNPFVVSSNDHGRHDPIDHLYPAEGEYPFTHPVSPETLGQVDEIRDKALSLGWTLKGLYQNRGRFKLLCGQDYGLVCYLEKGERIGEMTRESIEIIRSSGVSHRFYNRDVDQPWIIKEPEENN